MRILVTGATGFLGNNIARLAVDRGHEVLALSRSKPDNPAFADLRAEIYQADLNEPDSLKQVMESRIDAIIHCAAHIHCGWKFLDEGMRVNRDGTRHLLNLIRDRGIRLIHVSTVNTLSVGSKQAAADEETPGDNQVPCTYVLSKRAAEVEVAQAVQRGQHAVIVHPGFMLGPYDWKPSSGKMVCEIANRFIPVSPSGGCSVCDPRDVGNACLNAIDLGQSGRHYILAGENVTYYDLWHRIARLVNRRGPYIHLRKFGKFVFRTYGQLRNYFFEGESEINSATVAMTSQFHWYSSQRAIDELQYTPRSTAESIADTVAWFRKLGMIPPSNSSNP